MQRFRRLVVTALAVCAVAALTGAGPAVAGGYSSDYKPSHKKHYYKPSHQKHYYKPSHQKHYYKPSHKKHYYKPSHKKHYYKPSHKKHSGYDGSRAAVGAFSAAFNVAEVHQANTVGDIEVDDSENVNIYIVQTNEADVEQTAESSAEVGDIEDVEID